MPPSRATEMAQQGFTVSSAKAANGETVHINDHVYASSPWSERDGTPYIIARILDFLPPGAAKLRGSTKTPKNELHVRLALYYRPSDISGRAVSDFRLLLAAIHTIVEPISVVRGRCYVRHKDKIEDLIKWKHTPDHFYFVKFFDPYIKREYEVVRTVNVNNIPPHVKDVLLTRYEYLLIEKEMVSDMLDAYKCCAICTKWAASLNSVRCELCKQFYHMQCLTPPLSAKPAKGYSWGCLPCTIQRRKDVESEKYRFLTNGGSAPAPPRKSGKKEKAAISNTPDVMFRGWPWRYFGLYSNAEDALNPEDLIYPRAVTRVGQKYQANVMTVEEQAEAERKRQDSLDSPAGPSRMILERGYDPGEKKHESTITLISKPSDELTQFMEEEMKLKMPVPAYDVRRMNKAVESFTTMGPEKALSYMQSLKLADFNPIEWTPEETRAFEQGLELYGGLNAVAMSRQLSKRPAEVLKFSYMWKNKKLKSENDLIRQHRKVHAAHARNNRGTLGPPSLGKIRSRAESETSDDEGSLHNASYVSANRMQCAACSTRNSNVWWKCPRTVQGIAMCESCGSNYRKYGVISFVKADDAKGRSDKKEPKSKRAKGDTGSGTSTPVPQSAPKLPPCSCCRKMEPKATMARCKTCTFSVHAGCYGIPQEALGPNWECELCANAREPEANLDIRCMLCPKDNSLLTSRIKSKKAPVDFDLLSVLKPTEGCQWAHLLCATWFPDVQYTDGATFKKVEGISTIPDENWDTPCSLCMQTDGAVIQCTDCGLDVHPSCAWLAGYRFGFEFTLIKPGKRDAGNIARFKDEAGIMAPGCWCKNHDLSGRSIHDMFEIDPEQGDNALQVYTNMYKTIPASESFALLRKAHRLDLVESRQALKAEEHAMDIDVPHVNGTTAINPDTDADTKPVLPRQRACAVCSVTVSPLWHTEHGTTTCHQCWFKSHAAPGVNGVGGGAPAVALSA